ncbi:heavy metal sensor histidine kinase [Acinetobacter rathckeae]|uniref:heavy metal sensor histidine kinase n=1 Tax=Acinetobacter rathckeae TaxID=2605272 RepID=UPI0018A2FA86|nr:heavy metal sensor histidine kinase [Acinetobacter rathckeae]MBF7688741.1 heavy metal sensor histidine kinase [Acinetobacter rathckeae]MBF7696134.1 heavy metal sensor histidine kinase [Acinetobacter rathckeae]
MKNKFFKAIGFQIAIIFSISTITILIIMGIVIHHLVTHHFEMQDRSQLEGKVQLVQHILKQNTINENNLDSYLTDALVGHHDLIVQVERPIGHVIFKSMPEEITLHQLTTSAPQQWLNWTSQHTHYRGLIDQHSSTPEYPSTKIIVGIDTSQHSHFLNDFRYQLLYIGLAGTACLMFLGWFAAWRGLRPIQNMAKVAEGISAQHLSERLDIENTPLELQSLAIACNDMLDRLEMALAKLSDFSSDLAHEIRTPLNNLMTQTQVCLSRPREMNDYKEVLFSNLEELEHLSRMISDMLFLAKTEHGLQLTQLQPIDLAKETQALIDFYDALAAEKDITFQHTGTAMVNANPTMLRRALSNLFSNAIKYGQAQSIIYTECHQDHEKTIFRIKNNGVALSNEQCARLFDRFYRTDVSRQRLEEGTGLGLAITKSILDLHHASIEVQSDQGFIIFTIVFKGLKTAPHQA